MPDPPPPTPGPILTPNFLAVEEALGTITFPISRRDLLDVLLAEDESPTALLNGRNVDLADLVAELNEDFFDTEDDFRSALETRFARGEEADPEPLPTGPPSGWQADVGPGVSGDFKEIVDPPGDL